MSVDRRAPSAKASTEAIVFTAVLLAITLVLLASTFGLRASSSVVPRVVGVPLALLLCYRLIRELGDRGRSPAIDAGEKPGREPDELGAILWLFALPAVSTIFGFIAGPALYVFAWTRFRAGERTSFAAAATVFTAVAIWLLFVLLLGLALPQGLVGRFI